MAVVLRPVDRAVQVYAVAVAIIALSRATANPGNWLIAVAHAGLFALAWLVNRRPLGRIGAVIRETYPILLLIALYGALDVINATRIGASYDGIVRGWEIAVFHGEPARDWWRRSPSQFWSTIFHAAYFGYYFIVPAPVVVFGLRRELPALQRAVLIMFVTFGVCYLVFMLFPVAGPYYEYARPTGAFVANGPARLVYSVLARGSSYGAAFPSSHVAGAVAATASLWLGNRRLGAVLLVPTLLLVIGVVYCQMHYGVDVIAGVVLAAGIAIALRQPLEAPRP